MALIGRTYSSEKYRYGFNGQEKSNEIKGEGNSYTAEFWEYDPRIGRRWNLDPKPIIGTSFYSAFSNNPLWYNDVKGDTIFRPASMPVTFEDPMKSVLSKTPLGRQLLNEYAKSTKENLYFYAFDLEKSITTFKEDNQAIMNTVTALTVKANVDEKGKLFASFSEKEREGAQNQLSFLNASGFNFRTAATISIIGLNTTDDKHRKLDNYDLAFAMYHEIYAHVKLAKSETTKATQHRSFGNYTYAPGMGLYDSEIVGGSLVIQGSEAWKIFKQILELKVKNGDGTEQNKKDLKQMNQDDANAAAKLSKAAKAKQKKK